MSYQVPQKRNKNKKSKEQEFPSLCSVSTKETCTMDFKKLFEKSPYKKKKSYKMKKGLIKLTKNGIYDSLTQEERDKEEEEKQNEDKNKQFKKIIHSINTRNNVRRIYDPNYESASEIESSESEEEISESEEEIVDSDNEYDSDI